VEPIIIRDRGRGPELARIRVTVYDIIPYLERGRSPDYIASVMPITRDEVLALIEYIEQHKDEVMVVHRQIEERIARGNPPEVEAILAASPTRARIRAHVEAYRRKQAEREAGNQEGNGASDHE
jgi:uncharacterized protein (DUF433 family)